MKTKKSILAIFLLAVLLSSCMTLTHVVGNGGSPTGMITERKQWYALWGLVPVNVVESKAMAGGASDYTVKSQVKFVDYVISAFTGIASFNCQTVSVQK